MVYLTNIDLGQNQLMNAVLQPLATAPSNPKLGQLYCNSSTSKIMWYNGSIWQTVGVVVESSATNGNIKIDGVEMSVYTLSVASATVLGGIKVGAGLSIDGNGVLTAGEAGSVEWNNVLNKPTDLVEDASYVHTDNNYTTTEKNKLAGIAAGAEINVNADWNSSSGDSQILNKPTALSAFSNDSGFITNTVTNLTNYYLKTETYTQAQVNDLIGQIATIQIQVAENLPDVGKSNIIYLVPKNPGQTGNIYDEYIWTGTAFEKVGDTSIDLSNYLEKTGDASDTTVVFSQSSIRNNIATGDTQSILMGKISKYFNDLGLLAFKNNIAISDLPIGTVVDSGYKHISKITSTLAKSETTKTITITGTAINIEIIDSVTKEKVMADVAYGDANGNTSVTVTVSTVPTNALNIIITVIDN